MIISKINSRYHKYCELTTKELEDFLIKNTDSYKYMLYPFDIWWRNKYTVHEGIASIIRFQKIEFNDISNKIEELPEICIERIMLCQKLSLNEWEYLRSKINKNIKLSFFSCRENAESWERYRRDAMFHPMVK